MRLFIGIKTGCETQLVFMQQQLKKAGQGRFTDAGNLHLTLRFLGEVEPARLKHICEAITETKGAPFVLECLGAGLFSKSGIVFAKVGGDLCQLSALYARLEDALEKKGFSREPRRFHPHITLARSFKPADNCDLESIACAANRFEVSEVILYESRREAGRLVYAPLYVHRLKPHRSL